MGRSKDFVSKEEFIEILKEEGVTKSNTYGEWRKNNNTSRMPSNPTRTYNDFSWHDVGGSTRVHNSFSKEQFIKFVQEKGITTSSEYQEWRKDNDTSRTPAAPSRYYDDFSWNDAGGLTIARNPVSKERFVNILEKENATTASAYREWRKNNDTSRMPYTPGSAYDDFSWNDVGKPERVDNLISKKKFINILENEGVTTSSVYRNWRKNNNTSRMPYHPIQVYNDFSWKDVGESKRAYNPISKQRFIEILENENVTTSSAYMDWRKNNDTSRMPGNPNHTYNDFSWCDVGSSNRAQPINNPVSKDRFIKILENENVTTKLRYQRWRKNNDISGMPFHPRQTYDDFSWHDVGEVEQWNSNVLKRKIQQNSELYESLPPEELLLLLQEMGGDRPAEILESITGSSIGEALRVLSEDPEAVLSMFGGGSKKPDLSPDQSSLGLPDLDAAANQGDLDPETRLGQRIIRRRVNLCWQLLEQNESPFERFGDGPFSNRVKEKFSEEYEGALRIRSGDRWTFDSDPNLMQRRTAYLLSCRDSLINFSDVGTGKTLSAVLSAQVIGAKLTIVLCPASLREQWTEEIKNSQAGVNVYQEIPENMAQGPSFLVMSYEKLETDNREQRIFEILGHEPDFLIFDEVQRVKQRKPSRKSNRRKSAEMLVGSSDAKILALSALPVINNNHEGIKLLDLVGGDTRNLESRQNVDTALQLSHEIHKSGIRHEHHLDIDVDYDFPTAQGHWDSGDVLEMAEMGILAMEQLHIDRRLDAVIGGFTSGTVVYTHYVDDIVHSTKWRLQRNGFSVGLFTGDDKSGLEPFRNGDRDVLLASRPVSEGVEGLQHQADEIVFLSLPWTSARLDQTIGRLARSGFSGDTVTVTVPQVEIDCGGKTWSWCEARWEFVKSKRMLIDTILSGEIPEELSVSHKQLLREARQALGGEKQSVPMS